VVRSREGRARTAHVPDVGRVLDPRGRLGLQGHGPRRGRSGRQPAGHRGPRALPPVRAVRCGAALERWREDRERCAPTDAERGRAAAALEWARTLAPTSDYECNLALVARQAALDPKHAGILASAVAALNRALGHEMERRRREAENAANPSRHVGEIDQRIGLDLLVERVVETATEFGALNIIIARDARNNLFVWRTGAIGAEPGERLRLRATVKKHTEFRGQVQTELTRGSVLERITGPASTFKATPSAPPSDKPAKARKAKRPRAQADSVMAA